MTSCAFLCLTDGRDELLDQTLHSAEENLKGPITRRIIHTDNGLEHRQFLQRKYPDYKVIGGERLGFGGAYNRAWEFVSKLDEPFLLSSEDDFLFDKPVPLNGMMRILGTFSYLAQIVLCRQPWNDAERAAGGIIECWPDEYKEMEWDGYHWLEHRLHWSTNPHLMKTGTAHLGWPTNEHSERQFSDRIFEDINVKSSYWGTMKDHQYVTHVGHQRIGHTY